ncbi:MAG: LysM peptidoglycan-binding domain-containing protein, partial [Chitinivibrionales bacterium]|nr:LysM peptidoglycan-binding domain-containing protein [Chitinivibrionales bacterium]
MVECVEYEVRQGDTLGGIAETYYGESRYDKNLAMFNEIENPDMIEVGRVIRVPMRIYTVDEVEIIQEDDKEIVCMKAPVKTVEGDIGEDDIICYCPSEMKYFVVPADNTEAFIREVEEVNALGKEIAQYQQSLSRSSDAREAFDKAEEVDEKIAKKFKGLKTDPQSAIDEMLVVKSNKRWGDMSRKVHISAHSRNGGPVKGHWRKDRDASVKKQLQKYLKQDDAPDNKGMDKKFKATFFQTPEVDEQWPVKWKFGDPEKDYLESSEYFSCKAEARFCRFVAGATAGAELDWANKKFELGGKAQASFGLIDGSTSFSVYIPDKDGVDIFSGINSNPKVDGVIQGKREFRIRIVLTADGHVFAGAAVTAAARVPYINFSENAEQSDKKIDTNKSNAVDAEAELSAFGGASAEGSLSGSGDWGKTAVGSFNALGKLSIGGALRAGIGGELNLKIGYIQGKIRFQFAIAVVLGPGAKGSYGWEVDIKEGYEMVTYILESVDYHYLHEITSEAYEKMCELGSALFIEAVDNAEEMVKSGWKLLNHITMFTGPRAGGFKHQTKAALEQEHAQVPFDSLLPHSIADMLTALMLTTEVEDFTAILNTLKKIKTLHKLKSVLRVLGER